MRERARERRLRATVHAADGVIETLERADGKGFAAGTQWHNELMWRGDERFLRPFEDLVAAARAYAEAGRGAARPASQQFSANERKPAPTSPRARDGVRPRDTCAGRLCGLVTSLAAVR